uniref:ferritin family protein n=1 Tax=Acinetobacter indicus TaxID=756892 RepID=UPI0014441F8E
AREEREHGIKLIEYLSMRGLLTDTVNNLITLPTKVLPSSSWNGVSALTHALDLETKVTTAINNLISVCEGSTQKQNDYHLVDYLSGVYLEEQYKGQREIAGRLATLKKMENAQGALGEFLFDKQLL